MNGDILWQIGPFTVYTVGVSLALGFLTATVVAIPHLRRRGIRRHQVLRLMLALMVFSVLGARFVALLSGWLSGQVGFGSLLLIPPDGLSYYGGLVTTLLTLGVACALNRWPLLGITDALVPAAALGLTVGLSVPLATNLLHLQSDGPAGLNLLLFSVAYGGTYLLWQRRDDTRFVGESTLLLVGGDSLLRLGFGYLWTFGLGPSLSIRPQVIALCIVAVLWFSLRGAAQRRRYAQEFAATDQAKGPGIPAWLLGYTVLAGLILVRLYSI